MKRLNRRRHGRSAFTPIRNVLIWLFVALISAVLVVFSSSLKVLMSSQFADVAAWAQQVVRPALALVAPSFDVQKSSSMLDLHSDLIASQESASLEPKRWSQVQHSDLASDSAPGTNGTAKDSIPPLTWGSASLQFVHASFTPSSGIWMVHLQERPSEPVVGLTEVLEFPAIPLAPGQSIELLPDSVGGAGEGGRLGYGDLSTLGIQVICIGATPDRLDAPGKLQLEAKRQTPESSTSAPAIVNVSHAPTISQVSLLTAEAAAAGMQPERIKLTWSNESSGTLLILGLLKKAPSLSESNDSSEARAGSLFVTANEVWSAAEFFGQSFAQLKLRSAGVPLHIQNIWPEYSSSVNNQRALMQQAGTFNSFGVGHAFTHRVDVQLDSAPELKDAILKYHPGVLDPANTGRGAAPDSGSIPSRSIVTFERLEGSAAADGVLDEVTRLVRLGGFVHLNFFPPDEQTLSPKLVEAAQRRMMGEIARRRLDISKLRSLSIFARPQDLMNLSASEESARIDGAVARLVRGLDEAANAGVENTQGTQQGTENRTAVPYSSTVIHVSHFEDLAAVADRPDLLKLPRGFAPGSALVSPVSEPVSLPWHARLAAGVSQVEWIEWMAQTFSAYEQSATHRAPVKSLHADSRAAPRSDSEIELIATTRGDQGTLYVFDKGWVFLPRLELENIGLARQQLPVYGIATDLISDAKHEIFRLESGLQRIRVDVVLHGAETNRRIEIRSEFPILRCSASRDSVTFSKVFGQDGTMTVTADVIAGAVGSAGDTPESRAASSNSEKEPITGVVVSCLVDKSVRNPVPKPRSERQERPDEARARAEAKAKADAKADRLRLGLRPEVSEIATFTIRMTEDGKKFPLERIAIGPYLESADISASESARTRSVVQFDLAKDFRRLLTLVTPEVEGTEFSAVILCSATSDLDSSHPTVIDWQPEVETFLEDRVKIAERVRASKL